MSESEPQAKESCEAEETCFCMGAGPELFSMLKKLGPDSARQHFRNARVEMLKGMRVLIDKRIDDLSESAEAKGTRVTVE
jgi:hypothetical protein